jgi:hypothetical protein
MFLGRPSGMLACGFQAGASVAVERGEALVLVLAQDCPSFVRGEPAPLLELRFDRATRVARALCGVQHCGHAAH